MITTQKPRLEKRCRLLSKIKTLEHEVSSAEQERAEAVRRYERAELAGDYSRLNELERQLADTRQQLERAREYLREAIDDVGEERVTDEQLAKWRTALGEGK